LKDSDAATVDHDPGAEELNKLSCLGDGESVIRRSGVECPAADVGSVGGE
jgi:hypothetical protein